MLNFKVEIKKIPSPKHAEATYLQQNYNIQSDKLYFSHQLAFLRLVHLIETDKQIDKFNMADRSNIKLMSDLNTSI